jgi:hypothetical protein
LALAALAVRPAAVIAERTASIAEGLAPYLCPNSEVVM